MNPVQLFSSRSRVVICAWTITVRGQKDDIISATGERNRKGGNAIIYIYIYGGRGIPVVVEGVYLRRGADKTVIMTTRARETVQLLRYIILLYIRGVYLIAFLMNGPMTGVRVCVCVRVCIGMCLCVTSIRYDLPERY